MEFNLPSRFPMEREIEADIGKWWVIHTKPNCEKKVAQYLLNRGVSYYLPLYDSKIRTGSLSRSNKTIVPLFRGYVSFASEDAKHSVLYDTKKLVRIIKVENQDKFVSELNGIRTALDHGNEITVHPGLLRGRRVRIVSGPLQGTEAKIVRFQGKKHLTLSVDMFNKSVLLRIDSADFELI